MTFEMSVTSVLSGHRFVADDVAAHRCATMQRPRSVRPVSCSSESPTRLPRADQCTQVLMDLLTELRARKEADSIEVLLAGTPVHPEITVRTRDGSTCDLATVDHELFEVAEAVTADYARFHAGAHFLLLD